MKYLAIALFALSAFATTVPAQAGNCRTTCYGNTCDTYCW